MCTNVEPNPPEGAFKGRIVLQDPTVRFHVSGWEGISTGCTWIGTWEVGIPG